jgi:chaperonin GroES
LNIKPVFDRLTVERIEQADKTASGKLFIPEDAKAPSQIGRVLAVGQGRNYDGPGEVAVYSAVPTAVVPGPDGTGVVVEYADAIYLAKFRRPAMVVKVGDLVIYGKYSGAEVEVDGKKVFILREDEVLGIVEEEAGEAKATEPQAAPEEEPVH